MTRCARLTMGACRVARIRFVRTRPGAPDELGRRRYEPEPGTDEGDAFEVLLTLIESYETRHFPISAPDPVEAIKFRMDQGGLTPRDLEPFIGPSGRVSEVLNRKRPLSLRMVKRLHDGLKIPYESLLAEVS